MRLISHRGNLFAGQTAPKENTEQAVYEALSLGFEVEVDLWKVNSNYYLGHDYPQNQVSFWFLVKNSRKLWFHCKNKAAFRIFRYFGGFMHESEPFVESKTIFSKWRWNHSSNHNFDNRSVCVMPELHNLSIEDYRTAGAVCSDDIANIECQILKN